MTILPRVVATILMMFAAGTASAVGDVPAKLGKRQAASIYAGIRSLLTNDGITCPNGQVPVSGEIAGGSAPSAGSQTITIAFNKGAIVKIIKAWGQTASGSASSNVNVTCS